MRFNHLILQITDTCPLQCAYCCVESGPWRLTSMAYDDACSYVRQAKQMNPDTLLSFTGGEPFVRFTLMRDIARFAHELGMAHTVVTSAVWCKSIAFTRARLAELQRHGLRAISVSYDSFHQPWVTPDRIQNCVTAGVQLGLTVAMTGSLTADAQDPRALLGGWLDDLPTVQIMNGPVQPTGRGALIPLEQLLIEDWGEANLACPATGDLFIRTDGTTYPCCSTGGDYDYLALGNARETPLHELRAGVESALWFRLIATGGFQALEQIVRRYHPAVEFPRHHVGVCHLCQLVFGTSELGSVVRDALARFEADRGQAAVHLWTRLQSALAEPAG